MNPRNRFPFLHLAPAPLVAVALLLIVGTPTRAQNLVYTFSGVYDPVASYNDGIAFDGTDYTDLPPLLDLASLAGGTFTASFTIPASPTPSSQTDRQATYPLGPESSIQFTLFDNAGQVKYRSNGLADFVQARVYRFPSGGGNVNQVVYGAINGFDVQGVTPPPGVPILEPSPIAQFNFANYTDVLHTHLSDFSFPADPLTYMSFPERQFNVQVSYGDGDLENGEQPFRFFNTSAYYTVNSVRITAAAPEPASLALVALPLFGAVRRFRQSPRFKVLRQA